MNYKDKIFWINNFKFLLENWDYDNVEDFVETLKELFYIIKQFIEYDIEKEYIDYDSEKEYIEYKKESFTKIETIDIQRKLDDLLNE